LKKINAEDFDLHVNEEKQRYELHIGEHIPLIDYKRVENTIYLTHTGVPAALKGQGVGSALVKKTLKDIKQKELTLIPICPFIISYLKRHPEWQSLTT
jgi:predicted GNAT family acetyltransferase